MIVEFTKTGARVRAQWLGAVRTVFEGDIFECTRWVRQNTEVALAKEGLKLKH